MSLTIRKWYDVEQQATFFQYNEKPEALLVITDGDLREFRREVDEFGNVVKDEYQERVMQWIDNCESYEPGTLAEQAIDRIEWFETHPEMKKRWPQTYLGLRLLIEQATNVQ